MIQNHWNHEPHCGTNIYCVDIVVSVTVLNEFPKQSFQQGTAQARTSVCIFFPQLCPALSHKDRDTVTVERFQRRVVKVVYSFRRDSQRTGGKEVGNRTASDSNQKESFEI